MRSEKEIWEILATVRDPELPVLSVVDLGIVRKVQQYAADSIEILITPTYSGCPAMDVISMNIRMALLQEGFKEVKLTTVLSPAWSSDWISEEGRQKLQAYGVAPPSHAVRSGGITLFADDPSVPCPQCHSYNTTMISEFGSTACKSLYRCNDCGEPFDYFKCH